MVWASMMEITLRHIKTGELFAFHADPSGRRNYQVKRAVAGLIKWSIDKAYQDRRGMDLRLITLTVRDGFQYSPKILDLFMANLRAYFAKKKVPFGYVSVVKVQVERELKYGKRYPHWHLAFVCPEGIFPTYGRKDSQIESWWPYGFTRVSPKRNCSDVRRERMLAASMMKELSVGTDHDEPFFDAGKGWSRSQFSNFFCLPMWAQIAMSKFFGLQSISYQTLFWYRRVGRKVFVGGHEVNIISVNGTECRRKRFVPFHFVVSPWEVFKWGEVVQT